MGKKKPNESIPLSVLRKSRNMSQEDLARDLKVSRSLIGLYEVGKRTPSLNMAKRVAKYFNMPVESIRFSNKA